MPAIRTLRFVSITEAISFLLLIIAMVIRSIWNEPSGVYYMGRIHGGLFILLMLTLLWALITTKWGLKQPTIVFLASLVPILPFFLDTWLKNEQDKEGRNRSQ